MEYTDIKHVELEKLDNYYGYGELRRFFLIPARPCSEDWVRRNGNWEYLGDSRIVLDDDAFGEYGRGVDLWDVFPELDTDKIFSLKDGSYIYRPQAVVSNSTVDKRGLLKKHHSPGGKRRSWTFRNEDYEDLYKVDRRTLRMWEREGDLDRGNLFSVVMCYMKKVFKQ